MSLKACSGRAEEMTQFLRAHTVFTKELSSYPSTMSDSSPLPTTPDPGGSNVSLYSHVPIHKTCNAYDYKSNTSFSQSR